MKMLTSAQLTELRHSLENFGDEFESSYKYNINENFKIKKLQKHIIIALKEIISKNDLKNNNEKSTDHGLAPRKNLHIQ